MSGIPVYTQSPINATKASGVTPQTATQNQQNPSPSGPIPAPATITATSTSAYMLARPGAAAAAPTAPTQRYAPIQPTPTTTIESEGPPAPQPGSFPIPPSKSSLPPPPRAGETYRPLQQTAAPTQSYPPQMNIPPPTEAIGSRPPASSTSTAHAPSSAYPASLPFANPVNQQSMEHPPGYQQNAYAAELSADERRAHEAQGGSLGNQTSSNDSTTVEEESVWNTAKAWAQQAGDKLQAVEADVWSKINKK